MISSGPLLAASPRDWLGAGDIAGVRSLAATLHDCAQAVAGGQRARDGQAGQLTDPAPASPLAAVICRAASIVEDLSAGLTRIEHDLEDQAHTASRYGVRIGTDLRPPPAVAVPAAGVGGASEQHWALAYQRAYARAAADAQRGRQQAARQLAELHATLAPPRQPPGPCAAGRLTIGQFLTGLSGYLAGWPGAPDAILDADPIDPRGGRLSSRCSACGPGCCPYRSRGRPIIKPVPRERSRVLPLSISGAAGYQAGAAEAISDLTPSALGGRSIITDFLRAGRHVSHAVRPRVVRVCGSRNWRSSRSRPSACSWPCCCWSWGCHGVVTGASPVAGCGPGGGTTVRTRWGRGRRRARARTGVPKPPAQGRSVTAPCRCGARCPTIRAAGGDGPWLAHWPNGGGGSSEGASRNGMTAAGKSGPAMRS